MRTPSQLEALLERWIEAQEQGQSLTIEELCRDCPEMREQVQHHISSWQAQLPSETLAAPGPPGDGEVTPFAPTFPTHEATPSTPPDVPGFKMLDELGRGAMGVVYHARQLKLNREVALKMILAGRHAGPEERIRFLAEAEAVAAIQHPGIVQVYECGTHGDLPFFALEFCAGGSLEKKLAGTPLEPAQAAQLVEQVARAMQAAHQRGIIHRDLKPANILLDSDGHPKVGDFGLARKIEAGAGLTATGAVMGTPSYMAPEQARGGKDVGLAADVYALGAILYECLTGRPPFRSTTPYDTLLQVLNDEPVSPRRLNARVSLDLETICLKCLHKESTRRYASADEMAQDLHRWMSGQPILARSASSLERTVKWARRRPALAASLSTVVVLTIVAGSLITWQWQKAVSALARADREQKARTLAQVNALCDAAPGAVPGILQELRENRDDVLPRLRELFDETDDRGKRMRLALALIEVEPEKLRDELSDWLLDVTDPAEGAIIREALRPHARKLRDRLWSKSESASTTPAVRLRALAGLAVFDPQSARWQGAALGMISELVAANPLHLATWMDALRPVRQHLIGPLAEVYRDRTRPERRQVAAMVLADYAADQPDLLANLILDADEKQYALLLPVLKQRQGEAVEWLHRELNRPVDYWKDKPLEPAWMSATPSVRSELEQADGLVADRFALCQSLPIERVRAVTEGMRALGYRPLRIRPWGEGKEIRVAIVWTRDGKEWTFESDLSATDVKARAHTASQTGLIPTDLASYRVKQEVRYALLCHRGDEGEQGTVTVGLGEEEHGVTFEKVKKEGFLVATIQRLADAKGITRHSCVWRKSKSKPGWWTFWSLLESQHGGRAKASDRLLVDVGLDHEPPSIVDWVVSPRGSRRYASVWYDDARHEGNSPTGLDPKEHLTRCRELTAAGWRPVSLSVARLPRERAPAVASVWHRPVRSLAEQEQAARRQAMAAATLIHLGREADAWPLFCLRTDPTVRSYLIRQTGLVGIDPRVLIKRLDEENDVSARRALLLALGEYTEKELPGSVRAPLVKKLLLEYRDHPDAGIHGAIDWLLRHGKEGPTDRSLDWGQKKNLAAIDKQLQNRGFDPRRGWYVTSQGQTMVVMQGPGEFRLGTPHFEPEQHDNEGPRMKRIARRFAIASKPLTLMQWLLYAQERKLGRDAIGEINHAPDSDDPVFLNWYQAAQYCNWLSEKEGIPREQWCYPPDIKPGMKPYADYLKRTGYRLPTEAEWEYACRAGTTTSRYFGSSLELQPRYSWYVTNSQSRSWPVGQKRPNDLGLFDMLGNVTNWCQDRSEATWNIPLSDDIEDTNPITEVVQRVRKGGYSGSEPRCVRSAHRYSARPGYHHNTSGLRVVRTCP
jgi:formylglycine-generating enzyme required for sulfatase activity/tRNA A-37 threonylcarbamoyl transferase component Bud32